MKCGHCRVEFRAADDRPCFSAATWNRLLYEWLEHSKIIVRGGVSLLDDFAGFYDALNFIDNSSAHAHYIVLLVIVQASRQSL